MKWKTIKGFPAYQVSDSGEVRSVERSSSYFRRGGKVTAHFKSRPLKKYSRRGYWAVGLFDGSKQIQFSIHRLVAEAFVARSKDREYVNHIDGDKRNNRSNNLEWTTPRENTHHAIKIRGGSWAKGQNNPNNKLSEKEVVEIKSRLSQGEGIYSIGRYFGVTPQNIASIRDGRSWRYV